MAQGRIKRAERHVKMHLHPRLDADLLAFWDALPYGDKSAAVIAGLRLIMRGAEQPAPIAQPAKPKPLAKPVNKFVPLDDSEGFN